MAEKNTRTFFALKNATITGLVVLLNFPIQFINRYFMVHYLGVTYIGLTSLFTNILSVLSLADLGIGSAIVFLIYKPLAERNVHKTAVIMKYYRNVYHAIAAVIFCLGLVILPFLKFFLGKSVNYPHVYLLFIIYLLGSASSYLFSYNQSLLYADQRNSIVSLTNLVVTYVMLTAQIITVIHFKNPLLYATLFVFSNFVTNIFVSLYVKKLYELPKTKEKLSESEKKLLIQNVVGNMFLRISGVVVTGTDSMFLSAFAGVVQVGLYANYSTITSVIQRFMTQMIGAVTGSIGNFVVTKSPEDGKRLFFNLQFINFLVVNTAALGIFFLSNDVISIWLGEKYTISQLNVGLIALSFFLMNYRMIGWNFVAVYGLAQYMKAFSVNEMVANVLFTLFFLGALKLKLTGVLLGTICSTLFTVTWQDPYIIFRHAFHSNCKRFFVKYGYNLLIVFVELLLLTLITRETGQYLTNHWANFLINGLLVVIISIICPLIFYFKSTELKFTFSLITKLKERFI